MGSAANAARTVISKVGDTSVNYPFWESKLVRKGSIEKTLFQLMNVLDDDMLQYDTRRLHSRLFIS